MLSDRTQELIAIVVASVTETNVFFTPPMLDFRITLEARNPARHCSRHYRVEAGTDLFGVWVVEITYGRIGTAGRSRSYVLRDEEEARHLAQSILKRRATAPRRIGVAYRIREMKCDLTSITGALNPNCCASRRGCTPRSRGTFTSGSTALKLWELSPTRCGQRLLKIDHGLLTHSEKPLLGTVEIGDQRHDRREREDEREKRQ